MGGTIEDALEAEVASKRRLLRPAKYPDLEKARLIWIKEMRSQDIPLSGPVILAKAADFALQLDYDDFAASDGWLHRFRERYDLIFRAVSGEMNAVNIETTEALQAEEPPVLEHGVTAPMADALEDVCFADYVDVDSGAVVCDALTDGDIICQDSKSRSKSSHDLTDDASLSSVPAVSEFKHPAGPDDAADHVAEKKRTRQAAPAASSSSSPQPSSSSVSSGERNYFEEERQKASAQRIGEIRKEFKELRRQMRAEEQAKLQSDKQPSGTVTFPQSYA
ncbi:hypothetical protein HPB51_003031 [Rhipicephalus microplus]|uniref:HTH CENPB-type domain-containing protein n=1 Tax=Rhipicephalus microplus TaxID=6941 RepID=A0A9J6DSK9_RHIMP|nr:hypothetical protein HPB51_003031 [Rhipicephalus microplus]